MKASNGHHDRIATEPDHFVAVRRVYRLDDPAASNAILEVLLLELVFGEFAW